jgi:peptide/nickel transport system ATP-binding protein
VEAAVLDLVADLRRDFDTALLFISHNLGVVARVCQRVGVMYAGELVELASVEQIFADPRHPYTHGLLRALPKLGRSKTDSALFPIRGRVPAPDQLPPGCVFEPRCDYAQDGRQQRPEFAVARPRRALPPETIDAGAWCWATALPPPAPVSPRRLSFRSATSRRRPAPSAAAGVLGLGRRDSFAPWTACRS